MFTYVTVIETYLYNLAKIEVKTSIVAIKIIYISISNNIRRED
jgi:hypothetical protein